MNICLIGYGIPSLILGNILSNKNIKISIFDEKKYINKFNTRTVGITKNNLEFLKKENIDLKKRVWPIKNIKIYNNEQNSNEILNFGPVKDNLFSLIKNYKLIQFLEKKTKKNKNIKKIKKNKKNFYDSIIKQNHEFDLVINFDIRNKISKDFFYNRQNKNYNSSAHTVLLKHKKCINQLSYQVFSELGPIAFLPCSSTETSVVLSILNQERTTRDDEIINLIKKHNKIYSIKSISNIENFKLNGSLLKNYYYKNILSFGDSLHKIHPLAGQGLNMTLRDMKIFSELVDKRIEVGLPLDKSILKEFENKTKHLNYLFVNGIDFINEFFKFDNKFKNPYSKKIFYFLENNSLFKKYSSRFADRGFI